MRVMIFVKSTEWAETVPFDPQDPDTQAMMAAMGRFNDELRAAGILVTAAGLQPSDRGRRIAFDGDTRAVTAGPFAHPAELVAGFWIWDVKDMDEAIAWVKKCPNPMPVPSDIEIRPFYEFGNPQ